MKGLLQKNVSLAPLTSWRVGGLADYYAAPTSIEEVEEFLLWASLEKIPVTVLGGGSNVLVSDEGVEGLILSLRFLAGIEMGSSAQISHSQTNQNQMDPEEKKYFRFAALAGTHKSQLLRIFLQERLSPALFLSGLPGDVGGGVVMNAGVREKRVPREFGEIVEWIEVLRTNEQIAKKIDQKLDQRAIERVVIASEQIRWSYRQSEGWQPGVIVRVGMRWPLQPDETIPAQVKEANRLRLSKQPLDLPSGGSVFVNPSESHHSAGSLIEQCGLKGFKYGGAQVSEKHGNFIVNVNKATARDIDHVIHHVQEQVRKKTGIQLVTEIKYIGRWQRDQETFSDKKNE